MKHLKFVYAIIFGIVLFVFSISYAYGEEKASALEIVKKVREAAAFLSEAGEPGIAEFQKRESPWVWKDTYIFIHDCQKGTTIAHPIKPGHIGKNNIGIKDVKGNMFFVQGCEAAKDPKGGWIEYWWPKPGEKKPSRKISYMYRIPDMNLDIGAGVYDDTLSIEELKKLLD
ncbi:Double cache domain-containing protein [Desulfonema limicola]|uniref:Double cache domain-containing protein n=1 Tax=Desulfonema limicola TaxID=45656 RepID=A0A975GFD7_9BACT|nr:cache domain-containing protein [Desulfonema limicola]QTA79080.1 Double cache domain-containing protein [Desulfonema limicola]